MIGYAILAVLFLLPLVLGLIWRVSASHLFFSVMAGELLARYFGHDVEMLLADLLHHNPIIAWAEVAIQVFPLLVTTYFLRLSISKGRALLHTIPFVITGLVLITFTLPILPEALQTEVAADQPGNYLLHVDSLIIGSVIFIQLIALWFLNRDEHGEKIRKHSKL